MTNRLVIVESPTKAKTLKRYLGKEFTVESSVGHVRDLPSSAAEIPAAYKKEPWARLGVNVEEEFKPLYVVQPEKKKKITELKRLAKEADELLLATDEDREGEAISWHLVEVLKPKIPVRRMVFHEITKAAIERSLDETRDLNLDLVGAQETRRIIDRLYGYEVSPILWRKIAPRLSAGRVQSVATWMLVDRERARMRFVPSVYWDLVATFETEKGETFPARLHTLDGKRLASGKDFDPDTGELKKKDAAHLLRKDADSLRAGLEAATFEIRSAEEKPFNRSPAPPFTTSTLQQEGNRKLRFDAKRTMRAAQRLYENGFITYMRTDSVTLSNEAVRITRDAVKRLYGADYLPEKPRTYKTNVKNAQEAHEAIRPAGDRVADVDEVKRALGSDEARLYDLIWKRTLACQMRGARGRRMTLRVAGEADGRDAVFNATGTVIDFPGFLRAYVEGSDDPEAALADKETILPPVKEGEKVGAKELACEEHVTTPPPRLTEASLVKALEESGIGRPSTYASIIDTIERREYTFKKGSALVPTFMAFAVVTLMERHFAELIDTAFTAKMEDRLDEISRGEYDTQKYLHEFYYGNGRPGLRPLLDQKAEDIDPRRVCTIPIAKDGDGNEIVVRVGRYGPFLQRGETRAPVPEYTPPDELTEERVQELIEAGERAERPIGHHPDSDEPIYVKTGRFGPYVQLGDPDPEDKKKKPKMVSLLDGMEPATISLDTALELLRLPRTLGQDDKGVDVVAHLGPYGPYIKRGDDTRSLTPDDDLLTIDLKRAKELLAQEKKTRFRRQPKTLRVIENVAALDGTDLKILDGRYGPYVTDGDVNASLPKGTAPDDLAVADAVDLLARARERKGKKKKKKTARKTKKKTARKKTAKKKSTKKKAGKKKKAAKKKT